MLPCGQVRTYCAKQVGNPIVERFRQVIEGARRQPVNTVAGFAVLDAHKRPEAPEQFGGPSKTSDLAPFDIDFHKTQASKVSQKLVKLSHSHFNCNRIRLKRSIGYSFTKPTFSRRAAHIGETGASGEIAECAFMDLHTVVETPVPESHRQMWQRLECQDCATWTNQVARKLSYGDPRAHRHQSPWHRQERCGDNRIRGCIRSPARSRTDCETAPTNAAWHSKSPRLRCLSERANWITRDKLRIMPPSMPDERSSPKINFVAMPAVISGAGEILGLALSLSTEGLAASSVGWSACS